MACRLSPLPIVLVLSFHASAVAGAYGVAHGPVDPGGAVTISHGVKLSLLLAKEIYPRNALVRVRVRLSNVSHHPIRLLDSCPYGEVQVQVINRAGSVLYPPALTGEPTLRCGGGTPSSLVLRPGRVISRQLYAILRGGFVQALVSVARAKGVFVNVVGGPAAVTLIPGKAFALAVLLAGMLLPPGSAHGTSTRGITVSVVHHGVRLTLYVSRPSYPVGAVVEVEMRVSNLSSQPVELGKTYGWDCGDYAPQPRVMLRGREVYPPAVPQTPAPSCLPPPPNQGKLLRPAHALDTHQYVVLRGTEIQADLTLLEGGKAASLSTPSATVRLTRRDAPRVRVHGGRVPLADVLPPARTSKPLLYVSGYVRLARRGVVGRRGFVGILGFGNVWQTQYSTVLMPHLLPGYKRVVEWHAVAGWLNHSVASIDFSQR